MLYVFYGSDQKTSGKKVSATIEKLKEKRPNANFFRIESKEIQPGRLTELSKSVGLFENKHIVFLSFPLEIEEKKEIFLASVEEMQDSESVFIVLEGEIDKKIVTLLEKSSEKILESQAGKEKGDKNFAFGDALVGKDKKNSWLLFRDMVDHGASAEELQAMIWWNYKTLKIAKDTENAKESGLHPFVFQKMKRASSKFTEKEISEKLQTLVDIYYKGHSGDKDMILLLEKMILS